MTGKSSLDRSPAAPDAALVHLSGSRRGATEFISGDRIVLSPASDGGIELSANDETPPHSLAVLECRCHTFGLTVTPGAEVWINRERLTMYHSVPVIFRSLRAAKIPFPTGVRPTRTDRSR